MNTTCAQTHTTAVESDLNDYTGEGAFQASCTCGWSDGDHTTKVSALGAGDRHIARHIERSANQTI